MSILDTMLFKLPTPIVNLFRFITFMFEVSGEFYEI